MNRWAGETRPEGEQTIMFMKEQTTMPIKLKHPTKKQMQKVIERFEKILPLATTPKHLDMSEPLVHRTYEDRYTRKHECGTVHCVAGWYAVANQKRTLIAAKLKAGNVYYETGADLMARDLGFVNHRALESWANLHYEIWGNRKGGYMFCKPDAWNNCKTMRGVVNHLKRVQARLPG